MFVVAVLLGYCIYTRVQIQRFRVIYHSQLGELGRARDELRDLRRFKTVVEDVVSDDVLAEIYDELRPEEVL